MSPRAATVLEFRSRDADRTQQEILRAAMSEFAGHGFGGARIEAIDTSAAERMPGVKYILRGTVGHQPQPKVARESCQEWTYVKSCST